jgi:hypothetical protein
LPRASGWRPPANRRTPPQLGFAYVAVAAADPEPISKVVISVIAGIVTLFKVLFHGASPYDEIDTGKVEQGQNAVYQIWFAVSGEALYGVVDPSDPATSQIVRDYKKEHPPLPFKQYATWSRRTSAYPNVPKGPLGDLSIDIQEAIQGAKDIINEVWAGLGGQPGVPYSNGDPAKHLAQSEGNPFFTNEGSGVIALLQKVSAAREAAAVANTSTTVFSQTSTTAASLLPVAAAGLLIYALSAGD